MLNGDDDQIFNGISAGKLRPLVGSVGYFHFGRKEGREGQIKKITLHLDDLISFTYFYKTRKWRLCYVL